MPIFVFFSILAGCYAAMLCNRLFSVIPSTQGPFHAKVVNAGTCLLGTSGFLGFWFILSRQLIQLVFYVGNNFELMLVFALIWHRTVLFSLFLFILLATFFVIYFVEIRNFFTKIVRFFFNSAGFFIFVAYIFAYLADIIQTPELQKLPLLPTSLIYPIIFGALIGSIFTELVDRTQLQKASMYLAFLMGIIFYHAATSYSPVIQRKSKALFEELRKESNSRCQKSPAWQAFCQYPI